MVLTVIPSVLMVISNCLWVKREDRGQMTWKGDYGFMNPFDLG